MTRSKDRLSVMRSMLSRVSTTAFSSFFSQHSPLAFSVMDPHWCGEAESTRPLASYFYFGGYSIFPTLSAPSLKMKLWVRDSTGSDVIFNPLPDFLSVHGF